MLRTSVIYAEKKKDSSVKLNLVALMDIFTILVFFLLLNSGQTQTLDDVKFVSLPDSSSEATPKDDFVIHLGDEGLWLDDQKLASIAEIEANPEGVVPSLSEALKKFAATRDASAGSEAGAELTEEQLEQEKESGRPVTIMADKDVPYAVLKSVMATCSNEDFRDISLAVNRVPALVFGGSQGAATASETQAQSGGD